MPALPVWVIALLWPVSLCLPNLIYSGVRFADTLHIIKWTVTAMPVLIALLVLGVRLFSKRTLTPKLDYQAVIFAVLLVYCALMPLWTRIFSPTGYALEMACFACMFAFYVLTVQYWSNKLLKPILLLAAVNAVINTVFAELQIRGMNDLKFLQDTIFADIIPFSTIILPTPGNYIGNTAQQNMFGLWTAIAVFGTAYQCTYDEPENFKPQVHRIFSGALMAGAFWGLMNSTSRSAVLALACALTVMTLLTLWKGERRHLRRLVGVFIVLGVVFWLSMYSPRSGQIVGKTVDIIKNAETIGNRRGIWTTSASMFLEHPMGVGIGQFKWHYMEAQRYGFGMFPYDWYTWQYTHWAHNEFLQFFCEGGVIGGIIFMAMYLSWFVYAFLGLRRTERGKLSGPVVWACGLAVLITFSAGFTRPFHRIENIVWIMLAFAIISRFYQSCRTSRTFEISYRRMIGLFCVVSSIAGSVYLWSGIEGNLLLRSAISTNDARLQKYFLDKAQVHPIVYEETMRNLGYHYMQLGEQTDNTELITEGFNILWEHFNHEPHSEDISRILNFVQRYQLESVLREVASYFKPGTYHLKRILQKDSSGRVVNALLLMNGPGSDDQ